MAKIMINYTLIPTKLFLEQLDNLSDDAKRVLKKKIEILKTNPAHYKRIQGYNLFLFRIRFEDQRREKRVIYLLDQQWVKILCILERDKEYKDLKSYSKRNK